jgi:hypothetical protein
VAFSERIKLVIDVATGDATGPLRKLSTDLKEADGAFAKTRVAAGSAFDYIKQHAALAAVSAGAAIVAFGVKAVGAFQETALGAGELRDALGVTAEEASQLQEVAGDLGIGVDALGTAVGRMNRAAADTPGAFAEIGAEIKRNADGTINVTETFLEVVDALNEIPDASQRASAAQKIFGRGWQDMAELVGMGADELRAALDSVEGGKIIDDAEIARAREMRDQIDGLKGAWESFVITAGGALTTVSGAISDVKGGVDEFEDSIERAMGANISTSNITIGFDTVAKKAEIAAAASKRMGDALLEAASGAVAAGADFNGAADAVESLMGATEGAAGTARDHADAMLEEADAALEVSGAFRNAAEIGMDLQDAQSEVMRTAGDADASMHDLARSVQRVADLEENLADANAQAAGTTLNHTQRLDANNSSLLRQASQLQGPQRSAILSYIAQINGIPPERISEIEAELNRGSVSNAESVLNRTSRARDQTTTADARTGSAESALNFAARNRTATIFTRVVGGNVTRSGDTAQQQFGARERGGPVEAGEAYVVGEKRPELFIPDEDGMILPEVPRPGVPNRLVTGASTDGARVVNNIVIHTGADPKAVIDAIKKYERNNGSGWRS